MSLSGFRDNLWENKLVWVSRQNMCFSSYPGGLLESPLIVFVILGVGFSQQAGSELSRLDRKKSSPLFSSLLVELFEFDVPFRPIIWGAVGIVIGAPPLVSKAIVFLREPSPLCGLQSLKRKKRIL